MQGHFPVIARTGGRAIAAVFRTGAPHYGLSGTLATSHSTDGGESWSDPIEVAPRWHDVRNPAFGVDAHGGWLLAYWQAGVRCYPPLPSGDERRWQSPAQAPLTDQPELFVMTSTDHGRSWSPPRPHRSQRLAWGSPFGRIVTGPDGTLLMAAYGPAQAGPAGTRFDSIVIRSRDGGLTWGDESLVADNTSELSLCWVAPDHLVGAVRHADGHTAIVHSRDGGDSWSPPTPVTRALEHPADLCWLASGRLLLTFGRRRRPLGCGALVSDDRGATWNRDHEVILAGDGIGNDVGYPSTVQLDDGTIVTVLYFARGSAASEPAEGWGETSCQALHYREDLLGPTSASADPPV